MSEPNIRYQADVNDGAENSSYVIAALQIMRHGGPARDILEVGCSSGYMGKYLAEKGHRVTGIEPVHAAAQKAREVIPDVFVGGFDDYIAQADPHRRFDVVMFGDVLEHLDDPAAALQKAAGLLRDGGLVAISIPNVTHGGIRAMLLEGRWGYQDLGILDRTHLRFFSRQSLVDMCSGAGFEVADLQSTIVPLSDFNQMFKLDLSKASMLVARAFSSDPDFQTFQFVGVLRPGRSPAQAAAQNQRWLGTELVSHVHRRGRLAQARDRLRAKAAAAWHILRR